MCRQDIEVADHDGEPDRRAYPPCRRRAADKRNEIAASQFSEALLAAQLHLTRCRKPFFTADHFRTVLIAPSLRLAHSPLEDGRKRPDERSTQPTYFYACSPSSIAASTFGGDIGSSVSRRPVARSIALAMAAIGGARMSPGGPPAAAVRW